MLTELKVSHFAIIQKLSVNFANGLNVMTGETGSGKSLLLKSLALLMGEKSSSDIIQTGEPQASVEGFFDLKNRHDVIERLRQLDLVGDSPAELVVRRVVSQDGKNRVYLNGHLSTLQQLRDIVSPLVEIAGQNTALIELTGQHENKNLQSPLYQLEMLDAYAGLTAQRIEVEETYSAYIEAQNQLHEWVEKAEAKSKELDFLKFQRDEIEALDLKVGDDLELESQISRFKNKEKLSAFIHSAEESLYSADESALAIIQKILHRTYDLNSIDPQWIEKLETPLKAALAHIEEALFELRSYSDSLPGESEDIESLEQRLSSLRKVQKKFGPDIDLILEKLEQIRNEISQIEKSDQTMSSLQEKVQTLEATLLKQSEELHEWRKKAALKLQKQVQDELVDLNMKGVIFTIEVEKLERVTSSGQSLVRYMIQPSKKDTARPLAKIASGGELSRILLALKAVVGAQGQPRTYLFDEVDAGVSGETAEKVGRKLKSLAKDQQVICITHLPQVAAFSDHHLLISKIATAGSALTTVESLDKDLRIREIARLLSGEKITKTSLANAKELLGL